jgi:hypothetical protein
MNFTSLHDVKFKVFDQGSDRYLVKYYSGVSRWPKIFRAFNCATDEARREMFYFLGQARFCEECRDEILTYTVPAEVKTCRTCTLKKAADNPSIELIPECPVCYQKMLQVDGTRKKLACQHTLCVHCCRRMIKHARHVHYDMIRGPQPTWTITCPMCRHQGLYDSALNVVMPNQTLH